VKHIRVGQNRFACFYNRLLIKWTENKKSRRSAVPIPLIAGNVVVPVIMFAKPLNDPT